MDRTAGVLPDVAAVQESEIACPAIGRNNEHGNATGDNCLLQLSAVPVLPSHKSKYIPYI
jgi:hypothetical protein